MSTAKKKGDLLEYAVHQIEKALIASYPQLAGQNVTIEPKKIFKIDGIRQEADLWITANPDTPLESHHLIECKDHNRAVGVGEVDKLAKKRERLGASKALLIARRFSQDAAIAAKKSRVELVTVTDAFWSGVTTIRCAGTTHCCHQASLTIHFVSPTARERTGPINSDATCVYNGAECSIRDVMEPITLRHISTLKRADALFDLEGLHPGHTAFQCEFDPGELFIDGEEVTAIEMRCAYTLEIRHGKITARFSVAGLGGFARFEYPPGTFGLAKPIVEICGATPVPPRNAKP